MWKHFILVEVSLIVDLLISHDEKQLNLTNWIECHVVVVSFKLFMHIQNWSSSPHPTPQVLAGLLLTFSSSDKTNLFHSILCLSSMLPTATILKNNNNSFFTITFILSMHLDLFCRIDHCHCPMYDRIPRIPNTPKTKNLNSSMAMVAHLQPLYSQLYHLQLWVISLTISNLYFQREQ